MARFWHCINELPENQGNQVYLLVSPRHYGRGLSIVYKNVNLIKSQLEKGQITYDPKIAKANPDWILFKENGEPEIEIGDTNFDKYVMRTMMNAKTTAPKKLLEERLKVAEFYEGLPNRF